MLHPAKERAKPKDSLGWRIAAILFHRCALRSPGATFLEISPWLDANSSTINNNRGIPGASWLVLLPPPSVRSAFTYACLRCQLMRCKIRRDWKECLSASWELGVYLMADASLVTKDDTPRFLAVGTYQSYIRKATVVTDSRNDDATRRTLFIARFPSFPAISVFGRNDRLAWHSRGKYNGYRIYSITRNPWQVSVRACRRSRREAMHGCTP